MLKRILLATAVATMLGGTAATAADLGSGIGGGPRLDLGNGAAGISAGERLRADAMAPAVAGNANATASARSVTRHPPRARASTPPAGSPGSGITGRLEGSTGIRPTVNNKVTDAPDFRS